MKIFLTVGNKNIANKTETLPLTSKLTEQTKILMFMSKVYSYPIKNRKILARKKKMEKNVPANRKRRFEKQNQKN